VIRKKFEKMPVPGGKEICERQLFALVEKMRLSEVNHEQINPFMDKVYETLSDLPKEEIIKRFVSLEFNRFLNYYNDATDLNLEIRKEKPPRKEFAARDRKGKSMSRIIFNLGKGKDLGKRDVIDLMVAASGRNDLEIGPIEIYKRASSVEVDSRYAKTLIAELNRRVFKGIQIEAEENYEFTGNDYRDRNKGPRGKRRKG